MRQSNRSASACRALLFVTLGAVAGCLGGGESGPPRDGGNDDGNDGTPPVCSAGWADCDGDPSNGCETSLSTPTDCGACGRVCPSARGTASCNAGVCSLACDPGYADCDGFGDNGCEVALADNPSSCAAATPLLRSSDGMAALCGDEGADAIDLQIGTGSRWFSLNLQECSNLNVALQADVQLTVPSGLDYDLFVYDGCGNQVGMSRNSTGMNEAVHVCFPDVFAIDDGRTIYVEVRFFAGAQCDTWTLSVVGNMGAGCF